MTARTQRLEPVTVRLAPVHDGDHAEALSHLAALEHLNQMIAGFASMVSHETRSSLVGIQGWSELIRDGGLSDDEIRSCASEIFDGAQRIEKMIGQMFDLNHLETRQVALRKRKVDLNAMATEVVARNLVRQPVPPIALTLDPAIPPVAVDPDRLAQAIDNFVTFARRKLTAASKGEHHHRAGEWPYPVGRSLRFDLRADIRRLAVRPLRAIRAASEQHHGRRPRAGDREGHRRAARRASFGRAVP